MKFLQKFLLTAILTCSMGATAWAQDKTGCEKPGAPQEIDGKVVKVDVAQQQITIQNRDGTTHVMQGNQETLNKYKPGDNIKATLRCPK
ncbi:MAG TPA: hypothetical protein VFF74_04690 [Methylophilaceae bacterium]|nr:hypothetical protein [Methylophilaceae bacterium]